MKAVISNFRRGVRTQNPKQMILVVKGVTSREKAAKLVGKTVVFRPEGKKLKEIKGIISAPHGSNGAVRAVFEKGMPGQAISQEIEIL